MTTSPSSRCPFAAGAGASTTGDGLSAANSSAAHADRPAAPAASSAIHPPGIWPPGPSTWLTGWSLLLQMSRDLPAVLEAWRREYGDIVHLRIWPEHQVVVTDPQLVRELLVNHHDSLVRWERGNEVFAQLLGNGVLVEEGKAWQVKRRALQPAFLPKSVNAFVPTIAAATANALERWRPSTAPVPVGSAVTALAMDVIMRMMFSSSIGDDARMAERAVHQLTAQANDEMYWPASWPEWTPWMRNKRRMIRALRALIDGHVQARLAQPAQDWPDDLLSRLLELHRAAPSDWPLDAVRDECMTAFVAGHETTAATLSWWMWCMAANPQAQQRAQQEVRDVLGGRPPERDDLPRLAWLGQTVQETLRLYPAAPVLMSRRTTAPIALGGYSLPVRTIVMVPVGLLQRDARWFPEPEAFRPERFAPDTAATPRGAFMPFGSGPHVCLGQHLALAEMTVIAAMILQRFALAVPEGQVAPKPVLNVTWRPDRPLHLRLAPLPQSLP